jgi:hypothetical protein
LPDINCMQAAAELPPLDASPAAAEQCLAPCGSWADHLWRELLRR